MKHAFLCLLVILGGVGILPGFCAVETGSPVPELEVKEWVKGSAVSPAPKRNNGKITVLFFWTISQQGTADFEKVAKLSNELGEKEIRFIGIGCDGVEAVKKFFRLKELPFPVAADDVLKTTNVYMRKGDRIPLFAVVDREGKLVWRGHFAALPEVLREVREGKFDLEGQISREKFADAVGQKMHQKDYEGVIVLLDGELKKHPGNMELIALKARVTAALLKKVPEAVAYLESVRKASPKSPAIHELATGLLRSLRKNQELSAWYDLSCRDFSDRPMLLLRFARRELSPKAGVPNLADAVKLMEAALKSPKFKDDREHAAVCSEAARVYYFCGRPDLALAEAKKAAQYFKKSNSAKEYDASRDMVLFYTKVLQISQSLGKK